MWPIAPRRPRKWPRRWAKRIPRETSVLATHRNVEADFATLQVVQGTMTTCARGTACRRVRHLEHPADVYWGRSERRGCRRRVRSSSLGRQGKPSPFESLVVSSSFTREVSSGRQVVERPVLVGKHLHVDRRAQGKNGSSVAAPSRWRPGRQGRCAKFGSASSNGLMRERVAVRRRYTLVSQ